MRIMTVASLFSGLVACLAPSLLALGRPGARTGLAVFYILTYLILLLVLVPAYSYLGAGIAYLVAEILVFFVGAYVMYRLRREYIG